MQKKVQEFENMALLIINHFSLQRMSISEALDRAHERKKWQPVDAKKFGNHVTVRTSVHPYYHYTDANNR